jgi:Fe-S oxidoreductase
VLEQLLRQPGDERAWLLAMPREEQPPGSTIIYLGCNVFRTTHLAQTVAAVLDRLGIDHLAVGGPAFCCGNPVRTNISAETATKVFDRTARLFGKMEPTSLVNWCPSCERQELRSWGDDSPYRTLHFIQLLLERMENETLLPVEMRVAIHDHDDDAPARRDAANVRELMARIPGFEFIDLPSRPELGYHCGDGALLYAADAPPLERYIAEDAAYARERGADALMSVYHSCHRNWSFVLAKQHAPIGIENYISIVARALGITPAEDLYAQCAQRSAAGEFDEMLAELQTRGAELGIAADAIERVLTAEFAIDEPLVTAS